MKLRVISALIGVLCLSTSASALTRPQFQAKVAKYAGGGASSMRGICVCKEAGTLMNRAGYLVISTPAGAPGVSGVGVTCAIPSFYNSNFDFGYVSGCHDDFVILSK